MTLKQWADNGWLESHVTSGKEIANLLEIVDRDLADAGGERIGCGCLSLIITIIGRSSDASIQLIDCLSGEKNPQSQFAQARLRCHEAKMLRFQVK